jgi:NADH:ubiquinone reductase (H+-translocating)
MTSEQRKPARVVVVGGGFAGIACARELAKHADKVDVTLLDRNDYHQFQPLLYQVATSMLAPGDIAYSLRRIAAEHDNMTAHRRDVVDVDPAARSVTTASGETFTGDYLVLAAGSQPNFFGTPGAEHAFPLYSLDDAERLRTRIIQAFEEADWDAGRADDGAITFVIVGGGPTGVEVAGALSEMINTTMLHEFPELAPKAKVYLVDHGHALLAMFADKGHKYTAEVLTKDGVELLMGLKVTEIGPGHVKLSDDRVIRTRTVIWGGGLMAAPVAGASGLPQGHGGRIDVQPDFTVDGFPGVLAIGDVANIPSKGGKTYPQLGSVALQSGGAAAKTILADVEGKPAKPFHYHDKGTMAMIGRGAAIAQVPPGVELHGKLAFAAWLGVHAALMTGGSNRVNAFKSWASDFFGKDRAPQALDRSGEPRMTWEDDDVAVAAPAARGDGG